MNSLTKRQGRAALPSIALCGAAILMSACATNYNAEPPNAVTDVEVDIQFDSKGCPKSVSKDDFLIDNAKRVVWQSVDREGKKIDVIYEIYFDPFKGHPLKSNPQGRRKSPPFDGDAPATNDETGITYKYSIVGQRCKDAPYDPRFRLRR